MEGMWFEIITPPDNKLDMVDFMDADLTRGDGTINLTSLERNKIGKFCCSVPNAISVIQTICVISGQHCNIA
jgi:hypothetical protein